MKKIGELNGIEVFESPVDGVYIIDSTKLPEHWIEQIRLTGRVVERVQVEPEFWRGVTVSMGPG